MERGVDTEIPLYVYVRQVMRDDKTKTSQRTCKRWGITLFTPLSIRREKKASPPPPLRMERGVDTEIPLYVYVRQVMRVDKTKTSQRIYKRWGITLFTPLSIRRGVGGEAFSSHSERGWGRGFPYAGITLKRMRKACFCSSQLVPNSSKRPICAVERTCLPMQGHTS